MSQYVASRREQVTLRACRTPTPARRALAVLDTPPMPEAAIPAKRISAKVRGSLISMGRPGAQVICSTGMFWSSHVLAAIVAGFPLHYRQTPVSKIRR
jgi:hypothetical protein